MHMVGQRLKEARQLQNLTQKQLADLIGVKPSEISQYESGKRTPRWNTFNKILDALNGTFQTNLSMDDITNLVKMQIDDMSPWKIESLNVDGKGGMLPTYSYPRQKLYVMEPNMETVKKAIQKLNEVLETP